MKKMKKYIWTGMNVWTAYQRVLDKKVEHYSKCHVKENENVDGLHYVG